MTTTPNSYMINLEGQIVKPFIIIDNNDSIYMPLQVCEIQNKTIIDKIRGFATLQPGWRYGEGVPPTKNTIETAINLYHELSCNANFFQDFKTNAFPNADGGITLSFGFHDDFIELILNPTLKMDLTHEKGFGSNYEILEEIYDIDINNSSIILTYLYRICSLLEQSTLTITTKTKEDLTVTYLKTFMGEFQCLKKNVREIPAKTQSAAMFHNFIQKLQEAL